MKSRVKESRWRSRLRRAATNSGRGAKVDSESELSAALREVMANEKIVDTASLVKAYLGADQFERVTLYEWLDGYLDWLTENRGRRIADDVIEQYAMFVDIKSNSPEERKLLKALFSSLCERIADDRYDERALLDTMGYVLHHLDDRIFEQDTIDLFKLVEALLNKLKQPTVFTKSTYSTHGPTLFAVYETLALLTRVDPYSLDPDDEKGVYHTITDTLKTLKRSARHYSYVFAARTIEQGLRDLVWSEVSLAGDVGHRVTSGVSGFARVCHGVRSLLGGNMDVNMFQKGFEDLERACAGRGSREGLWFDLLHTLCESRLLATRDEANIDLFSSSLDIAMKEQQKIRPVEDQTALRFGIIEQLRIASMDSAGMTHDYAVQQLVQLASKRLWEEGWSDRGDILEAALDAMASAHANLVDKQLVFDTLEAILANHDSHKATPVFVNRHC